MAMETAVSHLQTMLIFKARWNTSEPAMLAWFGQILVPATQKRLPRQSGTISELKVKPLFGTLHLPGDSLGAQHREPISVSRAGCYSANYAPEHPPWR